MKHCINDSQSLSDGAEYVPRKMENPAICDGMQNPWFGLRNRRSARRRRVIRFLIALFEYAKNDVC
jgi:hypothetical protein